MAIHVLCARVTKKNWGWGWGWGFGAGGRGAGERGGGLASDLTKEGLENSPLIEVFFFQEIDSLGQHVGQKLLLRTYSICLISWPLWIF